MINKTFFFLPLVALLSSCCAIPHREAKFSPDTVTQFSPIRSFINGVYDGDATYATVKNYGNFGIGTFNKIDGEMIALDGNFYQIKADGNAIPVDDTLSTPFATVKFFSQDYTLESMEGINFITFKKKLLSSLPSKNLPYAFKVSGTFSHLVTRSIPAQQEPYVPIMGVMKEQITREWKDVKGTMVGFWFPSMMDSLNLADMHLHFINDEHNQGGHVLDADIGNVIVEVDEADSYLLNFPSSSDYLKADLTKEEDAKAVFSGR